MHGDFAAGKGHNTLKIQRVLVRAALCGGRQRDFIACFAVLWLCAPDELDRAQLAIHAADAVVLHTQRYFVLCAIDAQLLRAGEGQRRNQVMQIAFRAEGQKRLLHFLQLRLGEGVIRAGARQPHVLDGRLDALAFPVLRERL